MTRVPDDNYLADSTINKPFSGIITVEDWHGNYIKGMRYSKGKIVKRLGAPETQNSQTAINSIKKTNDFDYVCTTTDYYTVYASNSAVKAKVNTYYLHYDYSETICDFVWTDDNDGGPVDYSGIGGTTPKCPDTSGPLTPDPSQQDLKHIINAFGDNTNGQPCIIKTEKLVTINEDTLRAKFPCASKLIIDSLLKISSYNDMVKPFTTSNTPNLNWTCNSNLSWGSNGFYQTGLTASISGGIGWSSTITLNEQMLKNSSRLLIEATSIHETLHAMINYQLKAGLYDLQSTPIDGTETWTYSMIVYYDYNVNNMDTQYRDHYSMMNDYFSKAMDILSKWDNNAHSTKEYAEALLFGLDNYGSVTDPAMRAIMSTEYSQLMSAYGITEEDFNNFKISNLNTSPRNRLPGGC